jgi:hypothetical protein
VTGPGVPQPHADAPPERPSEARLLARDLTGDLACARCGYNLRGLSIRATCPECDLPIRTTILSIVDPKAEEITPLTAPTLTAWGILAWVGGALLAAVCIGLIRVDEALARLSIASVRMPVGRLVWAGIGGLCLSGLASAVLIRPHRRVPTRHRTLVVLGMLLYAPLIWVFWAIHARLDTAFPLPYTAPSMHAAERTALRLCFGALAVMIILAQRPSARALAARSHVFRTGQIDRQSLMGLVAALAVAGAGDALGLLMARGVLTGDLFHPVQIALVALGSFLVTVGLFAAFVDAVRLRPVLSGGSVGLSHVLESNRARDRRAGGGAA